VARFANSQGVTNFKNGFAPDFYAKDELLPAYPLGELSEPLLRKAVEDITGEPVSIEKKGKLPFEFEVFYRGSSLFDQQKRNLYIEVSHNPRQIR
jgi:carboxyl-terminal processing protease